jgi:dTDP-glucose 4,6-dehydratase
LKILVTGGAGFIGSNFVRHVLTAHPDDAVVTLDKLTYAGNPANLTDVEADSRHRFVKGDICDAGLVRDLMAEVDAVVHFAAETHVDRSNTGADEFLRTNVTGTFTLLEAARGRRLARFIAVGTDEVYGSIARGASREVDPLNPSNPYSASKAAADLLARAYWTTHKLPVIVTRSSNNFGPYQYPEKVIPLFVTNALDEVPLPLYGDGKNVRDWLHVEDHCAGIMQVLAGGRVGEKYNVGGGNERTNLEIVDRLCDVLERLRPASTNPALGGRSYHDLKTFVPDRPGHDRRYAIDATKIRRELGWSPRHAFEDGLAQTAAWYLEHRDWCDEVQAGRYNRQRLGLG